MLDQGVLPSCRAFTAARVDAQIVGFLDNAVDDPVALAGQADRGTRGAGNSAVAPDVVHDPETRFFASGIR